MRGDGFKEPQDQSQLSFAANLDEFLPMLPELRWTNRLPPMIAERFVSKARLDLFMSVWWR